MSWARKRLQRSLPHWPPELADAALGILLYRGREALADNPAAWAQELRRAVDELTEQRGKLATFSFYRKRAHELVRNDRKALARKGRLPRESRALRETRNLHLALFVETLARDRVPLKSSGRGPGAYERAAAMLGTSASTARRAHDAWRRRVLENGGRE